MQHNPGAEDEYDEDGEDKGFKQNNVLPVWGNEKTMNLNSLILANIQGSPYFKIKLFELKTYHEVVDEIYYRATHLEPWEMGSRKTGGQTGMCGGVRGVGAGGIVSSAFCLLYKLFTLKLTRKQLTGMMNHRDSAYIRGLGFMYARYTLPPKELWDWFVDYLADEEEVDVKAGGGLKMYMGDVCRDFLSKLDWFGALFPRIPVPVQKIIMANLKEYGPSIKEQYHLERETAEQEQQEKEKDERDQREEERKKEAEKARAVRESQRASYSNRPDHRRDHRDYGRDRDRGSSSRGRDSSSYMERESHRDDRSRPDRTRRRSRSRDRRKSTSRDRKKRSGSSERNGKRSRSHERRSKSRERAHRR